MIDHQYYMILGTLDIIIASNYKDCYKVSLIWVALGIMNMIASIMYSVMGK